MVKWNLSKESRMDCTHAFSYKALLWKVGNDPLLFPSYSFGARFSVRKYSRRLLKNKGLKSKQICLLISFIFFYRNGTSSFVKLSAATGIPWKQVQIITFKITEGICFFPLQFQTKGINVLSHSCPEHPN